MANGGKSSQANGKGRGKGTAGVKGTGKKANPKFGSVNTADEFAS